MLLLQGATIYPQTGEVPFAGDILIKKKKIQAVGRTLHADAQVIDCRGLFITPGLIDAHSHIGISEEKKGADGNDCNESSNPVTADMRAIDAINPMDAAFHNALAAGVTTCMTGPGSSNVVGGQFALIKTYGRCIDDMIVRFPAAMKVALGENPKNCYGTNGNVPVTRMGVSAVLRQTLQQAQAQNDPIWTPVFEKKIPIKAHVHRADDILTIIRIAGEFDLWVTLDHCTEGHLIADEIAKSGFSAIVGPSFASRNKIEVAQLDFKTAGVLHKAGVSVALTMDHPVTLIQYLPLAAAIAAREGLGSSAALAAITNTAAKILGADDRIGSIQQGMDADLAIFDRFPLDAQAQCMYTLIDGQIVFERRKK